jgi:general secretion pathway protein C
MSSSLSGATLQAPSLHKSRQLLANTATFALLMLLSWMLASWTWYFAAPRETALSSATAAAPTDWNAARRLFGPVAEGSSSASSGSIRLKGVYAVDGDTPSVAVVNTGGKRDVAVRQGEEVEKGVTLASVQADHIEISRNGANERIELEKRLAVAPRGRAGAGATTTARGFRLNVSSPAPNSYALSRSELNTTLQDPSQLTYTGRIGTSSQGGVRMDSAPAGSLPDKLGLREGDVIKSINGQTVNSPGDLARLYGQFSSISSVRVEILRNGMPQVLTFQIQP